MRSTLIAFVALVATVGTGSGPARADIPSPDACTSPGQPCQTAGDQPGVCNATTCIKTMIGPDGGLMQTEYDCNACQAPGGAGGAIASVGGGSGGAGGAAGSIGAGGTVAAGGKAAGGGSSSGCAIAGASGDSGASPGAASWLAILGMVVVLRRRRSV